MSVKLDSRSGGGCGTWFGAGTEAPLKKVLVTERSIDAAVTQAWRQPFGAYGPVRAGVCAAGAICLLTWTCSRRRRSPLRVSTC